MGDEIGDGVGPVVGDAVGPVVGLVVGEKLFEHSIAHVSLPIFWFVDLSM